MVDLYQLEQLVTIAETGTLSKAAETLLISQPALTRSIQKLEDELGMKLFDRRKNKITLNDNGKLAVEYSKKVLKEVQKMVNNLQAYDRSKQTISIGSCAPAPIWGLISIFKKLYPEMKTTDEINSNEQALIDGLSNNQYSLIILNHPLDDQSFYCVDIFKEHLYLSVPPAHPLAFAKEICFEDLNGESVLLLSRIGFWNQVCLKNIPDSHLLIQEDETVFNELKKASALPCFRTDITILRNKGKENRVYVPITDQDAHVQYYAVYKKKDQHLFKLLQKECLRIDWENV